MPTAALLLWDWGSCRLTEVGRCMQGNGVSQGWALHKAASPLGAVDHAKVLPKVVGMGSVVAAAARPQPRGVGLQGAGSFRMPETSTPAPQLPGLGDAELWLLQWCQILGMGTGTMCWAAPGAHCRMGTAWAELPHVLPLQ